MFYEIQPKSIDAIIIRCLISFAVGGALRGSEYTAPCKEPTKEQSFNIVKGSRLVFYNNNKDIPLLVYFFFKSKKNGIFKREFAVMPCICKDHLPCAYHELSRLKNIITNYGPNTYLFAWADGSLVTYRDALSVFKGASSLVGANIATIGTHSARKARVVIGIKKGLPAHVLLLLGRWQALDSIKPYLHMEPLDLANALSISKNNAPASTVSPKQEDYEALLSIHDGFHNHD